MSKLRLKVLWKLTGSPSWTSLALISLCCVLRLCHSLKGGALPPSHPVSPSGRNLSQTKYGPNKIVRDNPKTNPLSVKPKTVSHVAEQFSWVPLRSCSPPRRPFPIKSFALSVHVSPWTIHFQAFGRGLLATS